MRLVLWHQRIWVMSAQGVTEPAAQMAQLNDQMMQAHARVAFLLKQDCDMHPPAGQQARRAAGADSGGCDRCRCSRGEGLE